MKVINSSMMLKISRKNMCILIGFSLLILMCYFVLSSSQVFAENVIIDFSNRYSDEIIQNPGMGVYVNQWRYKNSDNIPQYIKIIYQRFYWRELEKAEGEYSFHRIVSYIDAWKEAGYRPAFRVMSSSVGQGTLTPEYVFESGVPKVWHKPDVSLPNKSAKLQADPVYWHKKYLEKYSNFVRALGIALNGGNDIEFIDMGGIGIFGEMYLGINRNGLWTREELKKHGYSYETYFDAYKKMIDVYVEAFPNTQLFLNISRYPEIAEYAARHGVGLRFDGLSSEGNYYTRKIVSKTFRELCGGNNSGDKLKVPCMYEFALGRQPDQVKVIEAINILGNDPVSYLHLNIGVANEWNNDLRESVESISKKIGFRFRPIKFEIPEKWSVNKPLRINQRWINDGLASPYYDIKLEFYLVDLNDERLNLIQTMHGLSLRNWSPSEVIDIASDLILPSNIKDNIYKLGINLYAENRRNKGVKLAIDNNLEGEYLICYLEINNDILKVTPIQQ